MLSKPKGKGVSVFPSRRVMRKQSGRSNASTSAETVARSENCRARAFFPLLLGMLFRRLRGRDRSFCEWQRAGVLRLLYDRGTIPLSAPARLYIRRMAERRRSAPCCWGCGSDACAGRVRTERERRALPLRRIWSVFAAGDTALFCRGVGFPGRDVPKSIPLFRERSFGRRWQLSD